MELWGYCNTCDRWFYCPSSNGDGHDGTAWTCPVCGGEPTALENRAAT